MLTLQVGSVIPTNVHKTLHKCLGKYRNHLGNWTDRRDHYTLKWMCVPALPRNASPGTEYPRSDSQTLSQPAHLMLNQYQKAGRWSLSKNMQNITNADRAHLLYRQAQTITVISIWSHFCPFSLHPFFLCITLYTSLSPHVFVLLSIHFFIFSVRGGRLVGAHARGFLSLCFG